MDDLIGTWQIVVWKLEGSMMNRCCLTVVPPFFSITETKGAHEQFRVTRQFTDGSAEDLEDMLRQMRDELSVEARKRGLEVMGEYDLGGFLIVPD